MARNEEKAQSMLSRFRAAQKEEIEGPKERRPFLTTDCDNLKDAEKWRNSILRDIAKKVSQIQNAGLGEFRIRDLNDEINTLLRTRHQWELRIVALGGPNYKVIGPRLLDKEGKEVPGNRGYKYFGAARDLPGVRELFDAADTKENRKTRGELFTHIDADYYGYRDEEDGVILPLEAEAEAQAIAKAAADWETRRLNGTLPAPDPEDEEHHIYDSPNFGEDEKGSSNEFVSHVPVPSQGDIEQMLLDRRKQVLLAQYASEDQQGEEKEARSLVG